MAERYHDRFHLARALNGHGVLCLLEGNWELARNFSDRGLDVENVTHACSSTKQYWNMR